MGDEGKDRTQRADEGRAAFVTMMNGFREVVGELTGLRQDLAADRQQRAVLIGLTQETIKLQRASIEATTVLARQVAFLAQVMAEEVGPPPVPVPVQPVVPNPAFAPYSNPDPIAQAGRAIINGVAGRLNGGGRRGW